MSAVEIYMEGGGKGAGTKAALRQGMDAFLRELKDGVRAKSWRWKLVCCGSRNEAFRAFENSHRGRDDAIVVLLVDAESPVNDSPSTHLTARDGWDLTGMNDNFVHLMVQTMETWIVADPQTLADYYGQGFQANVLPSRPDLEDEDKTTVENALKRATRKTQKGEYHKIRHASELLNRMNSEKVQQRCRHCERLFHSLGRAIEEG